MAIILFGDETDYAPTWRKEELKVSLDPTGYNLPADDSAYQQLQVPEVDPGVDPWADPTPLEFQNPEAYQPGNPWDVPVEDPAWSYQPQDMPAEMDPGMGFAPPAFGDDADVPNWGTPWEDTTVPTQYDFGYSPFYDSLKADQESRGVDPWADVQDMRVEDGLPDWYDNVYGNKVAAWTPLPDRHLPDITPVQTEWDIPGWDAPEIGFAPPAQPEDLAWQNPTGTGSYDFTPELPGQFSLPVPSHSIDAPYYSDPPAYDPGNPWDIPLTPNNSFPMDRAQLNQDLLPPDPMYPTPDWLAKTPDERGDYLFQSKMALDALLPGDLEAMDPWLRGSLMTANNPNAPDAGWGLGNAADVAMGAYDTAWTAFNQIPELAMDAAWDPLMAGLRNQARNVAQRPESNRWANTPMEAPVYPLQGTVENIRDQEWSNPVTALGGFANAQDENFDARPWYQQIIGQALMPGGGIIKGGGIIDDLAKAGNTLQGQPLLDALGAISKMPGLSGLVRNVILPGVVGAGAGAASTELPWAEDVDPWKAAAAGAVTAILGNRLLKGGNIGLQIENVGDDALDALKKPLRESYEGTLANRAAVQAETGLLPQTAFSGEQGTKFRQVFESLRGTLGDAEAMRIARGATAGTEMAPLTAEINNLPVGGADALATALEDGARRAGASDPWLIGASRIMDNWLLGKNVGKKEMETVLALLDGVHPRTLGNQLNAAGDIVPAQIGSGEMKALTSGASDALPGMGAGDGPGLGAGADVPAAGVATVVPETPIPPVVEAVKQKIRNQIQKMEFSDQFPMFDSPEVPPLMSTPPAETLPLPSGWLNEPIIPTEMKPYEQPGLGGMKPQAPASEDGTAILDAIPVNPRAPLSNAADTFASKASREFVDVPTPVSESMVRPDLDAWTKSQIEDLSPIRDRTLRGAKLDAARKELENRLAARLHPDLPSAQEILRPDSMTPAEFAKLTKEEVDALPRTLTPAQRLAGNARQTAEAALQKVEDERIADDVIDWRASAYVDLDKASGEPASFLRRRKVNATGALQVELADKLDVMGQRLDDLLKANKVPAEVARKIVHDEQNTYIMNRFMDTLPKDSRKAFLEHLYISLHEGRWAPGDSLDIGLDIPKTTGEVAGWLKATRTVVQFGKNSTLGLTDFAVLGANALPGIVEGNIGLVAGLANQLLEHIGLGSKELARLRVTSPLFVKPATRAAQDVVDTSVGNAVGLFARGMKGARVPGYIVKPFEKADAGLQHWEEFLNKAQYERVMGWMRKTQYEGNLLMMQRLGVDISTAEAQRAAGNMANATTFTADLARENTHRTTESILANTAMQTRAQGNVIMNTAKLLHGTGPERIVAAQTILSVLAASGVAYGLSGGRIDLDPFEGDQEGLIPDSFGVPKYNKDFGRVTVPNPIGDGVLTFNFWQGTQVARAAAESLSALANGDPKDLYDAWAKFALGRTSGALAGVLKSTASLGYDPINGYQYPGSKGGWDWGSQFSPVERILSLAPVPQNVATALITQMHGKGQSASALITGLAGENANDVSKRDQALMKAGLTTDDLREDPVLKRNFYRENEITFEDGDAIAKLQAAKTKATEEFMTSATSQTTTVWRDELARRGDMIAAAYALSGFEAGDRPKEGGKAQWVYDFNKTYEDSRKDPNDKFSGLDYDVLETKQNEFWATHTSPEQRKYIIDYQLANKSTDAERLFIEDTARLHGFDPATGERLKDASGNDLPDYWEIPRHVWSKIDNDQSAKVLAEFNHWKDQQDAVTVGRIGDREAQVRWFLTKVSKTAPDDHAWDETRITDVLNSTKDSKETKVFKAYKEAHPDWRSWYDPDQHWDTILKLHGK